MASIAYPSSPLRTPRRPQTFAVLKSLVNVANFESTNFLAGETEAAGQVVINFPCMPDTLELARRANYYNAVQSPITPDGFHVYKSTDPLTIPVSFTLNAFDTDYCGEAGPLVLLSIAAKLHALAMPIAPSKDTTALAPYNPASPPPNGATEASQRQDNSLQIGSGNFEVPAKSHFFFPPACALQIVLAQVGGGPGQTALSNDGIRSIGINCVGFITDVRVVFKAPWLQGSFSSDGVRNMPSAAEYHFTFTHQPGYTNNVQGGNFSGAAPTLITTTARDIYERLYNTIDIRNNVRYAGLLDADNPQS